MIMDDTVSGFVIFKTFFFANQDLNCDYSLSSQSSLFGEVKNDLRFFDIFVIPDVHGCQKSKENFAVKK